jgi:hypothetical protein
MTIPPLYVDNPLERANLPSLPLETAIPAVGRRSIQMCWSTVTQVVITTAILQAMWILWIQSAALSHKSLGDLLAKWPPVLLTGFLLAVLLRPVVRTYKYSWLVIGMAILSGAAAFTQPILLAIFILASVSAVTIEMANHFKVLAMESVVISPKEHQQNAIDFGLLTIQGFVAAVVAILLACSIGLIEACWIASVISIIGGYHRLAERYSAPRKTYRKFLAGYLFYPSPASVPPGQIVSPAGNFYSRIVIPGVMTGSLSVIGLQFAAQGSFLQAASWILVAPVMFFAATLVVASNVGGTIAIRDRVEAWHAIVRKMRNSKNPAESESLLMGYVAADASPIMVDRRLCLQHIHVLGATGTNKSSMGLAPMIEQLISFGDASVIIIDLKGDSPEMYYAADAAVQAFRPQTKMQFFSLENKTRTQIFNPFLTRGWTDLGQSERDDILCTCCGLVYGFDYGKGFFTSCNSAVVHAANLCNPDAMSFRQLSPEVSALLSDESLGLLPELRKAGIHAQAVIQRLASYDSMNVTQENAPSAEALENRIELIDYFQQPQVGYFRLPSTTSTIGAPAIARLVLYFLIIAGRMAKRNTKVHVIIDEFQRVGSQGLDQMLQLARSHDIGLVLANQSMSDLYSNSPAVFHAVSGCCGIRQWFSVNSVDDINMLSTLMGTHEVIQETVTVGTEVSRSYRTEHVPRARVIDLHTMSENRNLSVLLVGGSGQGYARYNGTPFVCYNDYHITPEEFKRRKDMPWPHDLPGMIDAGETHEPRPEVKPRRKPRDKRDGNDDLFGGVLS